MGRYKGLGMPKAKKKKLEAARERLTKQVHLADTEINGPQAVLEPAAHVPAARELTVADKVKQDLQHVRRAAREASWIAAGLSKDVQHAKSQQQTTLKVVDVKMSQWLREAKRPVKAKRPNAYVQLKRCSKIEEMLHGAAEKVYVATVVAGLACLAARDAEIAARDVRIRQLLVRVRQLKK